MASSPRIPLREAFLIAALVLAGFAVRIASAQAEFWLDEIWSWEFSRMAASPWEIFFTLRHDNNHVLNTLMLALWPPNMSWSLYRMHSVIAGSLAILAAWSFGRRFGGRTALLTALLVAACPWFVWSSAEARGYAMMVLFLFVAADALWLTLDGKGRFAPAFWVASVLGVLAHPTFLHASIGFAAWAWCATAGQPVRQRLRSLAWSHGPVVIAFAALGLTVFWHRAVGGAPPTPLLAVIARLLSVGFGGPSNILLGAPWIIAAAAALWLGLAALHRHRTPALWLFVVSGVCMPLFVVIIQRPDFLFERYLFAAWALAAVPMAIGIERAVTLLRPARPLLVIAAIMGVIVLGDAWHIGRFLRDGRGDFVGAAEWILARDPRPAVQVTGNMPMRVEKYVRFYAPYVAASGRTLVYKAPSKEIVNDIDWLIIERAEGQPLPGPIMRDNVGNAYDRDWVSPARGLGSWSWAVYRKQVVRP